MLKPLTQEEGVSVWLYIVSRWQVKGTAPVSTRAQAHEGIKARVAVLFANFRKWVAVALDKADDDRRRDKRADSYRTPDCSTVGLLRT